VTTSPEYDALRKSEMRWPTGNDEQSQQARDMILDFVVKGYAEEVSPGVYKWSAEGIRFVMANSKPSGPPPPGSKSL
jgi:hypothetical protein